jgi:hypothetical protein
MNNEQRSRIEKTWDPTANISIPHYLEIMEGTLVKFAEQDLRAARKPGGNIVAGTHLGNIEIFKNQEDDAYTVAFVDAGTVKRVQMKKAAAVEFLVNAYMVTNE